MAEPGGKAPGVAALRVAVVFHRVPGEEYAAQGAHVVQTVGHTRGGEEGVHLREKAIAGGVEVFIKVRRITEEGELGDARGHGHRVAGEGAGLVHREEELNRIRAGRANVAILDGVRVESYGSKVPLNQVATISTPDARTIAIKPWDRKEIRNIEKAIMDSDVGITPENNGEVIRLGIPQPTEERRRDLVKQCGKIAEKAKVEVRNVRADIKDKLKKAIKDGLSEDNEKDAEQELQKIHDKYIKKLDELIEAKNKEIMTV